jgi:hypothetical protein
MNRSAPLLLVFGSVLLGAGCAANPWPSYEAAVRCHLDGKKTECDHHYRDAIAIDPQLQGIHSSYGMHLLQEGRVPEAEREFTIEGKNYPAYAAVAIGRLKAPGTNTEAVAAAPGAPPPPPPPGAAPAPAGLTPAAATVKKPEGAQ